MHSVCLKLTQQEGASERVLQIGALTQAVGDSSLPVAEEAAAALIALCQPASGMVAVQPFCTNSLREIPTCLLLSQHHLHLHLIQPLCPVHDLSQ